MPGRTDPWTQDTSEPSTFSWCQSPRLQAQPSSREIRPFLFFCRKGTGWVGEPAHCGPQDSDNSKGPGQETGPQPGASCGLKGCAVLRGTDECVSATGAEGFAQGRGSAVPHPHPHWSPSRSSILGT